MVPRCVAWWRRGQPISVNTAYCMKTILYFGCEVDHIISEKHGGPTVAENLAYACAFYHRAKGSDIGSIVWRAGVFSRFFKSRTDRWAAHFALGGVTILPLSDLWRGHGTHSGLQSPGPIAGAANRTGARQVSQYSLCTSVRAHMTPRRQSLAIFLQDDHPVRGTTLLDGLLGYLRYGGRKSAKTPGHFLLRYRGAGCACPTPLCCVWPALPAGPSGHASGV